MTTVILTWQADPLAFTFAIDEDIRGGDYGAVQRELTPFLISTPHLKFDFKAARFEIEERAAGIPAVIESLTKAGYSILHKGDIPAEIEQADRPN